MKLKFSLALILLVLLQTSFSKHTTSQTGQPDYTFFQGLDSDSGDIKNVPGQTVAQLKDSCNKEPTCLGFNTNGWLKNTLKPQSQWSRWTSNPNQGFYLKDNRFTFFQGLDSNGGDIKNIPGQTVAQLKDYCASEPTCLGFNTNGYVKKTLLPQNQWNRWSNDANQGFYVKNFQYSFFQGMDSNGGDIKNIPGQNVDQLKAYCNSDPTCLGFNTNGWVKKTLLPQNQWSRWSNDANQGFYLKQVSASKPQPAYTFFQGMDSNGGDIKNIPGQTVDQLKAYCNSDPTCLGFNTNGWVKSTVQPQNQWTRWSNDANQGFYLKQGTTGGSSFVTKKSHLKGHRNQKSLHA